MIHKTKGVVLNQIKYGDTSLIVQVYTEKFGRQSYMVKGGRSKKSAMKSNLFRPFFLLEMEVYHREGKNIQSIKEVRLCENLNNLVFDVYKSTMVFFLTEVCSKVLREEERNQELFVFLYNSIRYLDLTEESIGRFHLYFLSKLGRFLGFSPQLNWSDTNAFFDMDNGFFVDEERTHAHCLEKGVSGRLYSLFNTSIDLINSLKMSNEERDCLLRAILNFYALQIDGFTNLKSLSVLHELFQEEE
ncbi:DNA repair protein RecO [Labilibaculum antarcticum]|uniref:DNA repair protein RecO n=1 Tax=Labilibaculum antarcticum TaxID=1717717 RepID=A0A1Y1CI56_9BACT|nr:DNA repair protein RecO [Labilibaculum antarcticum]BAX80068.1 DNA repair protein RecO [Labilibaculum antarcticum]